MRYFSFVLVSTTMFMTSTLAITSVSTMNWWSVLQYYLWGTAGGWLISALVALLVLRTNLAIRAWLRWLLAFGPPAWLVLALTLRWEWGFSLIIVVSTTIIVVALEPRRDNSNTKTPGAMRRRVKGWFIQPPENTQTTTSS